MAALEFPMMKTLATSWSGLVAYLLEALLLCAAVGIVYRRYFHPLARIPGPFLPAVTRLYLWYYTLVKEGQFYKKIEEWHKTYGPIIRIAPNEIHLSEIEDFEKIFAVSTKFTKDAAFYGALSDDTTFTTINNERHRKRRAHLNPFFSHASVLRLEDLVQDIARKMCDRVDADMKAGKPVRLGAAFRALSIDIITKYAFDDSWNHLDREDLGTWWTDLCRSFGVLMLIFQQWPILQGLFIALPEWVSERMDNTLADYLTCKRRIRKYITKTKENMDAGIPPERYSIIHTLLGSDPSLYDINLFDYCGGEALIMVVAASDTTGSALGIAAFNVVTHPEIYQKLRKELLDAFPNIDEPMPYIELEKLPYLTGVVKESLRLSYGVLTRLARAAPRDGATFQGYFVPEGTTVSMSSWMMQRRADVFPSPETFEPSRWIGPPGKTKEQERWLQPFSRGSRSCLGRNLAMCELYTALAMTFRRFESLHAFDCGPEDMTYVEAFAGLHPRNARAFRVINKT